MKINSTSDSSKNAFLIFNQNKSPNLPKKNMTKTRTDTKFNLLNFNNNDFQEFGFNNTLRTKPNPINYPTLNLDMPNNNNNLLINTEQFNFNSFLNKIKSGDLPNFGNNNSNSGKNINIILYAPNYVVNKMDIGKSDDMESGKIYKTDNNINFKASKEKNKKRDDCPSNNKKNKKLFDSNFNLLEDECGDDELSQILKEFVHLKLDTPIKKEFGKPNDDDNLKKFTNTGDSVNCFKCEGSRKKGIKLNLANPYSRGEYKK